MSTDSVGLSAAELVRRFKEGKPTSREERERQRESVGHARMWWENDNGSSTKSSREFPARSVTPTSTRLSSTRISKPSPDVETLEEPRKSYLKPPTIQSTKRDLSNSRDLFRNSANIGNSMDVDYLIEKEIRNLEKDIKKKERETMQRLNMGSYTPLRGGIDRSLDNGLNVGTSSPSPHVRYRPTLRDHGVLTDYSDPRQEALLLQSADMFRSSVDTLGSTGILGLLRADLKLDGKKEPQKEKKKDEETEELIPDDVQIDLDELMKNLKDFLPAEKSGYLPDGVDETIPQITNRLHCQMLEFMSLYNGAMIREKEREVEQQKRDEEMKEEGRKLERERRLLELDIPPFQHPLDYVQGDSHANPGATKLGEYLRPNGEETHSNPAIDGMVPPFQEDHRQWRNSSCDAGFVARMLDLEMQQADATYGRMRQARQQMSNKLHHMQNLARDPQRYAHENQSLGGHAFQHARFNHRHQQSAHCTPEEYVDDGRGGYSYDDDYSADDPDFDPVRMQHDPQYRDQVLQRRSRRRQAWNPYPDILPENIFNTAKAIESMLSSAMDTLNRRLPEKRQPIPMAGATVSPRPATPLPSVAQRDAAMTPVPTTPRSATPVPTTPASVSSQGSNNSQQSITTATNTALNAGRSPAIPTTSTAPNATVVKPIATTPTATTTVAAAKPSTTTTGSTVTPVKPFPELKSDTSGHIERLVDTLVATAKEKVASGGKVPSVTKLDASNTSLDLSQDSNSQVLSAASSISLSSSHERLIPQSSTIPAASVIAVAAASAAVPAISTVATPTVKPVPASATATPPAANSGLRASLSSPVPMGTSTPAATVAVKPRATTPLSSVPATTFANGMWTAAQWDAMNRDLEYVDNVLNQVDRAPGRFDKYTQPNVQHRPPPLTATPALSHTANKTVTFASNLASISHDAQQHADTYMNGGMSRGILITPRANTPTPTSTIPDPLQNQNPGLTADMVDPLRELRQRAPHRVYENVLYRPGSQLHTAVNYGSSYGGIDTVFSGASAPALPLTIAPPSMNPQYHPPPQQFPITYPTSYPSPNTTVQQLPPPRATEGAAFRMLHGHEAHLVQTQQPHVLPHSSSFISLAPYANPITASTLSTNESHPLSAIPPPSSLAHAPTHERERFLSQMKTLRLQIGGEGGSTAMFRSPSSITSLF